MGSCGGHKYKKRFSENQKMFMVKKYGGTKFVRIEVTSDQLVHNKKGSLGMRKYIYFRNKLLFN